MSEYRIGEFAKKLCVTQDLLKHYEKYQILTSSKRGTGGYRYYDFTQSPKILFSKQFQNLGFSLKEISEIIQGVPSGESLSLFEQKLKILKREHIIQQWHIRYLEDLCRILEKVESGSFHGLWEVKEVQEYCFFPHSTGFDFIQDDRDHMDLSKWIDLQGVTMQGALIDGIHSDSPSLVHGIVASRQAVEELSLKQAERARTFGGNRCFLYNSSLPDQSGITTGDFAGKILKEPFNFERGHKFRFDNTALVLTHYLTREENTISRHRSVMIPML